MTESLTIEQSAGLPQNTLPKRLQPGWGHLNKRHTTWFSLRKQKKQGCRHPHRPGLSTVLSPMPSPSPFNPLTFLPREQSCLERPTRQASKKPNRQNLPFHRLSPFQIVSDQYADWGVLFEGAIAFLPSNPSFYSRVPRLVLMPTTNRRSITLTLQQPFSRITFHVRGYSDIRLSGLDSSGHCITHCKTFRYRYVEHHKAPLEKLTVEGRNLSTLILESSAPFVLEALSF